MKTCFGDILTQIREERGMLPKQVFLAAGLPGRTYYNIENGKRLPFDDELRSIAQALGTNPNTLLDEWGRRMQEDHAPEKPDHYC